MAILTLGHSTHTAEDFLKIAHTVGIKTIVDVRSHPSSHWPWWHGEQCREWLPEGGIEYVWMPSLGGWTKDDYETHADAMAERGVDLASYSKGVFPKQRIGVDRPSEDTRPEWASLWTNQGLYDYNWYTSTPKFRHGIEVLVAQFGDRTQPKAAIICAEMAWWRCHRSMVSDVLSYVGVPSTHIMPIKPTLKDISTGERRVKLMLHNADPRIPRYSPEVRDSWKEIN